MGRTENESKGTRVIRRKSKGLFVASVVVAAMLSLLTAGIASAAVTGAGSNVAGAVMSNWTNGFLIKEGIAVTYSSVGGEAGLAKLDTRSVDFAAADAPMSPAQEAACNGCAQIPWLLTGVDVTYKLAGVKKLNLSGKVLLGIFSGKVTRWNDPKIAALNPKAKLPAKKITVAYPGEASGETYTFTNYLSKLSPAWKKSVGSVDAVHFPTGTATKVDAGVVAAVSATDGSIGYVSATYASAAGLRTAAIENAAGNFEQPSVESFGAAGASADQLPASGVLNITDPPKSEADAYPLAMFGYAVVPHAAPQKAFVEQFLDYAVGPGAKMGEAFEIAPLPKTLKSAVRAAIGAL
jgi:phosphate transport system substrate-binding protein